MLTDMAPSAASQFYGTQIPAMGIPNIAPHIQKAVSILSSAFCLVIKNLSSVLLISLIISF